MCSITRQKRAARAWKKLECDTSLQTAVATGLVFPPLLSLPRQRMDLKLSISKGKRMRWGGAQGGGGKKASAWLMKEERTGKIETGLKRRTRSTGVGQMRCCFQKSQFNQQEMQLQREIADLPGCRSEMKEGKEKRERQVENGMFFWKPHVCGLCSMHPTGGEAPSVPRASPTTHLLSRPVPGSPGTL